MPADPLTHARKTYLGHDLSCGATVTTACGKRRKTGGTSTDPAKVDCPDCRAWFAEYEREMAGMVRAAADIAREYPGLAPYAQPGASPEAFIETAREHDARAQEWESTS